TDYSLMRRVDVRDDSILRRELVGLGKPLLLYSRALSRGILMSVIDEVPDPAQFSLRLETGHVSGSMGFAYPVPDDVRATRIQISPRLFFQVTPGGGLQMATSQYRQVMAALYPQPPLPDWVKYQWGSWYAFNMGYDEETLRGQIDYIAENLADLGPWSVLLDAGWYVAEGRPGSSWVVDEEKFPNGLRALVDYAHSSGVKVVLYFSAPYLDDREREGNWLGLRGFIEQHPDWLIPLQSDSEGASYVYDFTNPELVAYMRALISDFFQLYDVDGIKIDGLGQAEGEQLVAGERDTFGDVNKIRMFTMDLYRLIYEEAGRAGKDVYIESGWAIPNFATQYAHTFRYGDEFPDFENRYPAGGLLEHIDYATLQKAALGQRPNMGMVWGGPESQRMIRQWFEAALAMGTQMTLSSDLTRLSLRDLSALRAVLVHYNAFQGETRFVGMPFAQSFATSSDGITYLGALNRSRETKNVALRLADYGLDGQREYLMYDVSSARYSKVRGSFSTQMAGSSFRLFLLRDAPGMVWTNSSFKAESRPGSLRVEVSGPESLSGFSQIHVPLPSRVRLDGRELALSPDLRPGSNYWYDKDTGVLRLRYRHQRPHVIEVQY
ncbi:MAG: alpha-galactosidase, partial [Chloroflexota bacterium]